MKKYIKIELITLLIILIGTLISTILYYFNITNDKINMIFLYLISIIAFFISSYMLGKNLKYKGIISGIINFIIWFIIMMFLTLAIFKINLSFKNLIYFIVILTSNIFGGIIGKNKKETGD